MEKWGAKRKARKFPEKKKPRSGLGKQVSTIVLGKVDVYHRPRLIIGEEEPLNDAWRKGGGVLKKRNQRE